MGSAFTHYLMPKIEKMEERELEVLFAELGAVREQLPLISISDAGLKGLDVKPGDVVRITRDESEKQYYYRLVVED